MNDILKQTIGQQSLITLMSGEQIMGIIMEYNKNILIINRNVDDPNQEEIQIITKPCKKVMSVIVVISKQVQQTVVPMSVQKPIPIRTDPLFANQLMKTHAGINNYIAGK